MTEKPVGSCFSIGSVAGTYDEIYVPRIFIPWAKLLIERVGLRPGEVVLDVATGPGTVARLAAEAVGGSGRVLATDISEAMITIARQKRSPEGAASIEYLVAPAAPLPIDDAGFDVVLCQQGLQFFPDPVAALKEMHRALKRGGRIGAAVWCDINRQPSFAAMDAALRECLPEEQARPYGAPFRGPGARQLESMVREGGFDDIQVEEHRLPLVFEGGPAQLYAALAASPIATTIAELGETTRERLHGSVRRHLEGLMKSAELRTEMVSNIVLAGKV